MTDLQIIIAALLKIIWNFKVPLIYSLIGLAVIRRWEKLEKERMEEATKWDKLKGKYHQKHFVGRN